MGFDWHFEIEDKLSDRALRMDAALSKLEATSKRMEKALGALDEGTKKAEKSHISFTSVLDHGINIGKEISGVFLELGSHLFELGKAFAETAVEAAQFHEASMVGLTAVMGSEDSAARVIKNVVGMAGRMPIETGAAMQAARQLIMANFSEAQMKPLIMAMSDVGALAGGGEQGKFAQDMFIRQIKDIQAIGMSSRHLMFLSMETGLPEGQILQHIGKLAGWDPHMRPEEMKKKLSGISADTGITAILQTIADKTGGAIGNISEQMGKTVDGLKTTLKSRKLELFMNLDKSEGYGQYRGFLQNLVDMTDPDSSFAKNLRANITSIGDTMGEALFGSFSGPGGRDTLENLLTNVTEAVGAFAKGAVEGFATVFDSSNHLWGAKGPLSKTEMDDLRFNMRELGRDIGAAFAAAGETIKTVGLAAMHTVGYLKLAAAIGSDEKTQEVMSTYFSDRKGKTKYEGQIDDPYHQGKIMALNAQQQAGPSLAMTIHNMKIDASGHGAAEQAGQAAAHEFFSQLDAFGITVGGAGAGVNSPTAGGP